MQFHQMPLTPETVQVTEPLIIGLSPLSRAITEHAPAEVRLKA